MMKTVRINLILLCTIVFSAVAYAQNQTGGHEYVDLGLPSGTLWATCNVGADTPEAPGNFFAWGETVPVTQKTDDYFDASYSKYNNSALKELLPEDDAARKAMGKNWRMPTANQFKELTDYCSWEFSRVDGKDYAIATGPNGNTLVLPFPGTYLDPKYEDAYPPVAARFVHYWTSSLSDDDSRARYVYLGTSSGGDIDGNHYTSVYFSHTSDYRENCNAIRAVYEPSQSGDVDDDDGTTNCIVLWHKDGYRLYYSFSEKPKVVFNDDIITIESSTLLGKYPFEHILKLTYEYVSPDGIEEVEVREEMDKPFSREGESLIFSAADKAVNVRIVNASGGLVKAFMVNPNESKSFYLSSLNKGVYLINVNGVTHKIYVR